MKPLRLKNMIAGCLLAAGALPVWGQSGAPTLVIRIDDLGALHSVNEACIQTYRSGIARSVEVMPVAAWYPEAIKMLKENPGLDVGLHLVITSEWENVKWRPLTHCPSLTDENGYFYPMMFPNPAYPGQSIMEQKWDIKEIEQEFRAQIETTLKSIPQLSHLSGHMLSTGFSKEVNELVQRLAKEYNLPSIDRMDSSKDYRFTYIGYDGPKRTAEEKEASFIKALEKLQPGQRYLFLDHPALDNDEMKTVFHIGYEDVALDRQGVTDLLTSPRVRKAIEDKGIKLISINQLTKGLPRAAATPKLDKAMNRYLDAVKKAGQDLHSIMIVQHGNVIAEEWMGEGKEDKPHILNSVSKTFTATAVGLAASEGRLKLTDKVISFFPDKLPATVSENLAAMTVRDLLTMNCGHDTDPTGTVRKKADADWVQEFLAFPVEHKPGTFYTYNSLGTYMLSAIVQKVTGEKVVDYLYPRLFRPLGIINARWQESPQGINTGGWGLYLKTEDLAKMGQLFLQKGNWNGKQILPEEWVKEASACQVPSLPAGMKPEMVKKAKMNAKTSDWLQGYGYQMWRCRHNAYRADGANGQYILVLPDKDAVIAVTANIPDMQAARNLYTGKANAEIVNRLLESPRFAEVTYMIEQYFDDTLAAGFAGQNQMLTTLSAMLRRNNKTDAAVQAARTVNRQKVPVYQADLTMIQNTFMAALREVKKEIGNDFTAAQSLTKGITQQMFTELTKGADVHTPTITPEMISAAVTQSAAGMDGVQKEALDKFGQALTEFLQSTLDHAQEKQNADPEQ